MVRGFLLLDFLAINEAYNALFVDFQRVGIFIILKDRQNQVQDDMDILDSRKYSFKIKGLHSIH